MSEIINIESKYVKATIDIFGCMTLGDFYLKDRTIQPMYQAPWLDRGKNDFLSHLQGDFLCVPFGIYEKQEGDSDEVYPHGYSASGLWKKTAEGDSTVTLDLPYDHSNVSRVERTVTCNASEPVLHFKDVIETHADGRLPIGLHPIFKLPSQSGQMHLLPPECEFVKTYPDRVDESSLFRPDEMVIDLGKLPLKNGGIMDVSKLPKQEGFEEVIMLCNVKEGKFVLENQEEKYRVILRWDADILSNCLMWISNKGRKQEPWKGRNLCLGIEPIASAFDLGVPISTGDNELTKKGVTTSYPFEVGKELIIEHSIEVQSLLTS